MKWRRWAHRLLNNNHQVYYANFEEDRRVLKLYYYTDPIVLVELTEDPEGSYWGWIETDSKEVSRIDSHRATYVMLFNQYNPEAEVRAGLGRIVRLTAREVDDVKETSE